MEWKEWRLNRKSDKESKKEPILCAMNNFEVRERGDVKSSRAAMQRKNKYTDDSGQH